MLQIQQKQIEALQQEIARQQAKPDVMSGVKTQMDGLHGSITGHMNRRFDDHEKLQGILFPDDATICVGVVSGLIISTAYYFEL